MFLGIKSELFMEDMISVFSRILILIENGYVPVLESAQIENKTAAERYSFLKACLSYFFFEVVPPLWVVPPPSLNSGTESKRKSSFS